MIKSLKYKVYAKVDSIYYIHKRVLGLHRPKFKRLRSLVKRNLLFSKDMHSTFYPEFKYNYLNNTKHFIDYEHFFIKWLSTTVFERTKRNMLAKLLKPQMYYNPINNNKSGSSSKKKNFKVSRDHKSKDFSKKRNFFQKKNNS